LKLTDWAAQHFTNISFVAKQLNSQSPFSSAPFFGEFQLEASANAESESFNAGLLAFTLAKFGDAYTKEFFKAQLKIAGFNVVDSGVTVPVTSNKPEKEVKSTA